MSNAISSSDPQAIPKLEEKIRALEAHREQMKVVNAYYKKNKTLEGCPGLTDIMAAKLLKGMEYHGWDPVPYPRFEMTNSGQEVRRLKKRLQELVEKQDTTFVGWEFEGGTAEINTDIDRLQLIFDEKPEEEKRKVLKSNGFHWSPTEGAWQRQLNRNAIRAADYIPFVKPKSGQTPSALQPRSPARTAPEQER